MKVKELIAELQKYDGEMDVVISIDEGWDDADINEVVECENKIALI